MRDPLLDQNNAYFAEYRRARDATREEAKDFADAETIVSSLAGWCQDILFKTDLIKTANKGLGLSELLKVSPAYSPLQAFQHISNAAQRQSLEGGFTALMEGSENDQRDIMAWLFGQALAKALVDELVTGSEATKHLLAELWNLAKRQYLVHSALEDSLRERLHNCSTARAAILSELEKQISDINASPRIGARYASEWEYSKIFVDEWRSRPSIDKLWKTRVDRFIVQYDMLNMIPGILSTNRAAILDQLDRFDFPHPIRQILRQITILHDRDEIKAILKDAPLCSKDGRSWNGKLLALLVLQTAGKHCHDLWQAIRQAEIMNDIDSQIRETTKTTLASWFEDLGRIVMARPDGQFLGSQWLFMNVADERLYRAGRGPDGDQAHEYLWQNDLIKWITLGLYKAGFTTRTIANLVDFPKIPAVSELAPARSKSDKGKAQPRLGAITLMALIDHRISKESAEDGQRLLNYLDALLASRDPVFEVESDQNSGIGGLPASCCGYLLAHVEEPAERWRQSWDRLIEQRRRAQHWDQTKDAGALAPSLFLLAVGTEGIGHLLSSPHRRSDKAKELWRKLFDGARDCWLTISFLAEPIKTHIEQLFAQHPRVFDDSDAPEPNMAHDASIYSERLAQDLDLLGGDDLMLTICCLNARLNGATPEVIDEVLRLNSGRFGDLLQQFERWQQIEQPVRERPEIVEALAKLREEIEAVRDDLARNDTERC
ncbi:MAG: hypothetical protein OXI58_12925 [Gemmatimonadota bacterium]|nr:hypothetical protein [Gemmatimonadota bacterium]